MSNKSVIETHLETTCTHHFQFLSVAKDGGDGRKGSGNQNLWEKEDNASTRKV